MNIYALGKFLKYTVGEEAFEGDAEHLGTFVPFLLVGGDEAAHVHEAVLLGAHGHAVGIKDMDKTLYISNPKSNIPVGSVQIFLDEYLQNHNGKIDYVHGDDVTRELGSKENNMGIIFESMSKNDLFKTVILDGALPRKTFSMGHSNDKRFYLEARKIK